MESTAVETLETRVLFASDVGTAVLDSGTLLVTGTRRSDEIHVSLNGTDATRLDVVINGATPLSFELADVTNGMRVEGGNGHDTLSIDAAVNLSAVLLGSNGKDVLTGGGGADRLEGGNGSDRLSGGAGDDRLLGGNGADTLDGGDGVDTLQGGRGKDRVTGGAGTDAFSGDGASELQDKEAAETVAAVLHRRHGK
jgi:Ca2+-binding RTX toxin-like protein